MTTESQCHATIDLEGAVFVCSRPMDHEGAHVRFGDGWRVEWEGVETLL